MLKVSGLITSFYDMNLMGREFATEDELYHKILATLGQDPEVSPSDYVGVASNRFTPVPEGSHRYTSQVTYRILRIQDGRLLLPDKNVIGDSGDQSSDDSARTVATELAVLKTPEVLQTDIARAIRATARSAANEAAINLTSYMIRVDNVANPTAASPIVQELVAAGFALSPQFRSSASTETITIRLNRRSGADVLNALQPEVTAYQVVSMDEHGTVLRIANDSPFRIAPYLRCCVCFGSRFGILVTGQILAITIRHSE